MANNKLEGKINDMNIMLRILENDIKDNLKLFIQCKNEMSLIINEANKEKNYNCDIFEKW